MFAKPIHSAKPVFRRRGVAGVFAVIMLVMLMGMAALSVDVGMLYVGHSELQRAADAAALGGAWELLDKGKLEGAPDLTDELASARQASAKYAAANSVLQEAPTVDQNFGNAVTGDIVIGYLNDPDDPTENLSFLDPNAFNTVQVLVRRDATRNGPVQLLFARALGFDATDLSATATATFKNGVTGFAIPPGSPATAAILPFALDMNAWNDLRDGVTTTGDLYAYDDATGGVSPGIDNVEELNIFPGAGPTQLPPGNFGQVDIGSANNSTADLARQITDGVNESDMAYHGGSLEFDSNGYIFLNGDTGVSAGVKDELASIIGLPRTLPLFDQVTGPGNNSVYRIVGFAGVRIMAVNLTGAMTNKYLIVQPAFVVDDTAITGPGSTVGTSDYIYEPVRLVR